MKQPHTKTTWLQMLIDVQWSFPVQFIKELDKWTETSCTSASSTENAWNPHAFDASLNPPKTGRNKVPFLFAVFWSVIVLIGSVLFIESATFQVTMQMIHFALWPPCHTMAACFCIWPEHWTQIFWSKIKFLNSKPMDCWTPMEQVSSVSIRQSVSKCTICNHFSIMLRWDGQKCRNEMKGRRCPVLCFCSFFALSKFLLQTCFLLANLFFTTFCTQSTTNHWWILHKIFFHGFLSTKNKFAGKMDSQQKAN